jgi:hypothetical protein
VSLADDAALLEHVLNEDQPIEPLLSVANHWRAFVRNGDNLLEAMEGIVEAAKKAEGAEGMAHTRAIVDVRAATQTLAGLTTASYPAFKDGRERLYEVAKFWKIGTSRKSAGKPTSPLSGKSEAQLTSELRSGADNFRSDVKKMLDLGAKATRTCLEAARTPPTEHIEQKTVIDHGLDFRDAVSTLYARSNGILRRAAELSTRKAAAARFENTDAHLPWASDPEFGGRELL